MLAMAPISMLSTPPVSLRLIEDPTYGRHAAPTLDALKLSFSMLVPFAAHGSGKSKEQPVAKTASRTTSTQGRESIRGRRYVCRSSKPIVAARAKMATGRLGDPAWQNVFGGSDDACLPKLG